MRRIVSDTGPLLHLHEAACLHLLEQAGTIGIPTAVDREMARHLSVWHAPMLSWLTVIPLNTLYKLQATSWQQGGLLEEGEAEAIALARQLNATWLLTDDTAARVFAAALGLEVHGSLGIVLWAAAHRHLGRAEADAALERLAHSSLWISTRVLIEAHAALDALFT